MIPYGRQSVDESDIAAVVDVLRGDWLTTGPAVARFEQDLERLSGATRCVSVTSGTAALHVAYAAAGVGPGDEVVTTPMTFVATASSALALGATVRFADVEEDTANIDPAAVDALVTDRTKVIAGVDYAGHPIEADALNEIASRTGTLLLEDAAHSIGSTYRGRPVGSLADLTTFSFFPTKNMTTAEGGAVATTDAALGERAHRFHFIGLVRDRDEMRHPDEGPWHQEVHEWGLNYRLPDVLAALGTSQLRRLAAFKARRAEIFVRYAEALGDLDGVRLPTRRDHVDPIWHLYPLRVLEGRRREVFEAMRADGIGVQVNYLPVYRHPLFEDLGLRRGLCPNAEAFYAEELSLPMHVGLTDDDVDRVADSVRRAVRG
ncbi:DegT/DnrJ/EryC1/StrS family aminotransferase [Terracoccus luteus]|uniref:dTDP-4-amino-4,6-dideoxygalactose transaminase n=1 Tax=Terracoccus luteus TaxID=53356 RepID=A0A495XX34_9MICO|nr:DegT/DnrJ/EryC1/StrS family aminotransferase [Terracoccus luteus]MBB2985456.1 dTDP-4-amino-4,6-dideoxygalactose transaminase [Terracoccus luteus]MCP2171108.1 dTDP-4-amino-4,6-dideoxygalactose transaminase [Terracoccus luteus]RKT77286.1 dTDP-4-amino-4,6-dideoxygalactose transaminase [Terracoccus luteus]